MEKAKIICEAETIVAPLLQEEFIRELKRLLNASPYPGSIDQKPLYAAVLTNLSLSLHLNDKQRGDYIEYMKL